MIYSATSTTQWSPRGNNYARLMCGSLPPMKNWGVMVDILHLMANTYATIRQELGGWNCVPPFLTGQRQHSIVAVVMLENTMPRDCNNQTKVELIDKFPKRQSPLRVDPTMLHVDWVTVCNYTNNQQKQVMTKCASTASQRIAEVYLWFRDLTTDLNMVRYPATHLVRPHCIGRTTRERERVLMLVIYHQQEFSSKITNTTFTGLELINPFTHVPLMSLLDGFDNTSDNPHPIFYFIMKAKMLHEGMTVQLPCLRYSWLSTLHGTISLRQCMMWNCQSSS